MDLRVHTYSSNRLPLAHMLMLIINIFNRIWYPILIEH